MTPIEAHRLLDNVTAQRFRTVRVRCDIELQIVGSKRDSEDDQEFVKAIRAIVGPAFSDGVVSRLDCYIPQLKEV